MNAEKKTQIIKYAIIALAVVIVAAGSFSFYWFNRKMTHKPAQIVYKEYEELESAYSKALTDIEKVSKEDYTNIEEMKNHLQSKLDELKKQKELIDLNHKKSEELYAELSKNIENLNFKKDSVVKTAGKVTYTDKGTAEIKYSNEDVGKIININEELKKQNDELSKNLSSVKSFFEKEKAKNTELNAQVTAVSERLEKLKKDGSAREEEIKKVTEERKKAQQELEKSNKLIAKQNEQINVLVETLRKVNVDCYFVYMQGDKDKEAKIYITQDGLSKTYVDYFSKSKPTVNINFMLNDELFKKGAEKVYMRILNENNVEVFNAQKTISKSNLLIQIPGNTFEKGTYSVELKNGTEDLIIGGKYKFKIGK